MIPTNIIEGDDLKQLKNSLPLELFGNSHPMYLYQGFWCQYLENTIAFQTHFEAQETDIFISSFRKCGTTWLKALIFSICNREKFAVSESPLLKHNPHELVPQLESNIYAKFKCPDLSNLKSPRLFGTHIPFSSLSDSIQEANCKIVYISRNPLDTFISSIFFYSKIGGKNTVNPDMIEEFFDKFCEGKFPYGPFEDHALGYWKTSVERPEKVLFIKYEDLQTNPKDQLKRMAEFVGYPFTIAEDQEGVIDAIIDVCSIKSMKEAEVNNSGRVFSIVPNEWFFRKGEVGDWVNYLTPAMVERLEKIIEEKLSGTGLTFNYLSDISCSS